MQLPLACSKTALSLCLVATFVLPCPVLAALSASDGDRLARYEKTIFGSVRSKQSEDARIRALEINLFGKAHPGSASQRLDEIGKLVGSTSGSKFLPPMAAEMDRSAFAPAEVKQAPSAAFDRSDDDAPSSSSRATASGGNDGVKDMLRQALMKHNQGDMNGAEGLFRKVLSVDPRNSDANFNLGAMAEDRGDLTGARHYYQMAANASPSDHDIADALSAVNSKIHQQQQANQNAAAIEKQAQLKPLANDAAAAYKAGKYDQAISDLNRIAAQTPNDANVQFGLAQAYRGKGDLNRAYSCLQQALAIEPNNNLYRATMTDLQNDMQKGQTASNPPSAPDYRGGGGGGGHHHHGGGYGSGGSYNGGDSYNSNSTNQEEGWQAAGPSAVADSGDGGVQPFTSQGSGQLSGYAQSGGAGLGGLGGGVGGGLMGGMMGGMMGRAMSPYGGSYYGGSGSRLTRTLTGAAMGAVIGGMSNRYGYGGMRAGAMRGALTGGLFSLITGF